jgi:hypothetical protein
MLVLLTSINEGIGASFVAAFEDQKVSKILNLPEYVVGLSGEPKRILNVQLNPWVFGRRVHNLNNSDPNHSLCSWIFHSKFSTAYFLDLFGETYIY